VRANRSELARTAPPNPRARRTDAAAGYEFLTGGGVTAAGPPPPAT